MASRKQDLLGRILDTTLQPDDYDPTMDSDGGTALYVPLDANLSDDTEADDAFSALREELSPGEATSVVETMRPLSAAEQEILRNNPGLKGLTRVDDAEHEDWMIDNSRRGYEGLDPILDDAVYGASHMNHNEEKMEQLGLDSDTGFGFRSIRRGISKGLRKAGKTAYKYSGAKKLGSLAKKFVPNRDAAKAKLVKNLHKKLWVEHANWLGLQDQKAGLPLQPQKYAMVSKLWATEQIRRGGLPTKFTVGKDEILGADILGSDIMGSWWNPLSWFSEKSNVIVNQTQGARSPYGPDGQPLPDGVSPDGMDPNAVAETDPDPNQASYPQPEDASEGETDMFTGITGEDSLGAFATEILSGVVVPDQTEKAAKARQFLNLMLFKIKNNKPLSPMDVAKIATLSKEGDPVAAKIYPILLKNGSAIVGDDSGAWTYMLNPTNWFKSSEERKFKAAEIDKWKENAELQKKLAKRQEVLEQAQRAKTAAEAVAQAKAQAASTEAQLKEIESSLSGELIRDLNADVNGTFVGHEKPTAVTAVVLAALDKTGKRDTAHALYGKISKGEPLSPSEIKEARQIARVLNKVKVVHGDLISEADDPTLVMHGAFVGACIMGGISAARERNAKLAKAADHLSNRIASGEKLTPAEKKATAALIVQTQKLRDFTKSHITGQAFVGHSKANKLRRVAFVGAAKVMSPTEKKMLADIVKLAQSGNPRAIKALATLKKSGEIMGGDFIGSFLSDASNLLVKPITIPAKYLWGATKLSNRGAKKTFSFIGKDSTGSFLSDTWKYATMPITVPTKYAWKATKWTGRKLGITKGGSSPEQVRLAKLAAARKRAEAAQARARAADAETEAELRAQQAIASAADAEADAADAAALAKEAAMRTKEIEANPDLANLDDGDADSSGEFVGGWTEILGKDTKEAKIVAKASEKSATGTKIRSGAKLYKKIAAGDPKAKAALKTMIAKANSGDQQAKRDLNAVWAGRTAIKAKEKAQKKQAVVAARKARKLKVISAQRKIEARIATKLVRTERKMQLTKYAKIEAKAAKGNKRACAYVAKQAAAAKKGDKKAKARIEAMKLGRTVRQAAPTKRERRNLAVAGRVVARAKRNDPKALRQIAVTRAAAKQGNPNAKRAVKRLETAAVIFSAIETGNIVGKNVAKKNKQHKAHVAAVQKAKLKLKAGTASREELAAGARSAQALGDKNTAGELAVAASQAPSATETLKKTATVVAAKQAGNPEAASAVSKTFEEAKAGDPAAIKKMSNVVAVQTIDDINKGKPVSQTMTDAINLQQRAAAGDPAAVETLKTIPSEATKPNPIPEATAAAIASGAAAVTIAALASKPKAREQLMAKVNPPLEAGEKSAAEAEVTTILAKAKDGTVTAEEGQRGVRLAERLGKPTLAAQSPLWPRLSRTPIHCRPSPICPCPQSREFGIS